LRRRKKKNKKNWTGVFGCASERIKTAGGAPNSSE